MKLVDLLAARSNNQCEICTSTDGLKPYEVPPTSDGTIDDTILICEKCRLQLDKKEELDTTRWNCLTTSMWSEVPAVQVVTWRLLNRLRNESWAAENLDMMYLSDEHLAWAKATGDHENDASVELHRDANGHVLQHGDSVVLVKSLDVKGSTLNAKMGTVVRNIRLVEDNKEQIEGRVEGQLIVILTKYVRRQNG
ncbi:PhnA protein [Pseudoflavitalea sp. G-6-1-2]|uniref:PhnA domain-containing protein n=1 Tax=Pseudoflavitalea sp. G-6-1-2 TaxID=2728841 RepID=UPI00146E29DD|nr:alkylphosphonate utilization protein [Pseudoflavitalea sp. G-6-1-2]NML20826.1 PhnA protein [Pseudoflavitalea sp. G-6-1-2]